jgi:ammonia channel protein AmtB
VPGIDTGDTAWVLVCAALVMFMTPGLAFFYGGLVRAKHVLGTIMQSFIALGLVTVLWALVGYSLAFGPDKAGLIAFTHAAFAELRERGIKLSVIVPGLIDTAMSARAVQDPAILAYLRTKQPLRGGPGK